MTKFRSKFSKAELRKFIIQFFIVVALCLISYFWIDRSLAVFIMKIHPISKPKMLSYDLMTFKLTDFAYDLVLIIAMAYVYLRLTQDKKSYFCSMLEGIIIAVVFAFFIKTELRYFFGRIPPRYMGTNVLLFIRKSSLYGFRPFSLGSFPSGHMSTFTAGFLMISRYYPKTKPYTLSALVILAFLLLYFNDHFLSDIISGTYLGYIIMRFISFFTVPQASGAALSDDQSPADIIKSHPANDQIK